MTKGKVDGGLRLTTLTSVTLPPIRKMPTSAYNRRHLVVTRRQGGRRKGSSAYHQGASQFLHAELCIGEAQTRVYQECHGWEPGITDMCTCKEATEATAVPYHATVRVFWDL